MAAPDPKNVQKRVLQSGLMPVFYHEDPEICMGVMKACYDGGIRVFEFTNHGARNQEIFLMLKKFAQRYLPEMYVGMGAVKSPENAGVFIGYNADFIACPIIDPATAVLCREKKVLWIPGCSTPTEIATAEKNGASLIKLFPGALLGPAFIKSIQPHFPGLQFLPADGVEPSAASIIPWLDAGVATVTMGRKMITEEMLTLKDFTALKNHVKKLLKTIRQWKQQSIA